MIRTLISLSVVLLFLSPMSRAEFIKVNGRENLYRLLKQEDTDKDKRITIEDNHIGGKIGDKKFNIEDVNGNHYEVTGVYYLANLLQEMKLAEETGLIEREHIFEQPVYRISRMIEEYYWDGLTRRIDEENIVGLFKDTKTRSLDKKNYIYVPHEDKRAFEYFKKAARKHPSLRIEVVRLPQKITAEWVKQLEGYHGILTLKLKQGAGGELVGEPFVVPGGRFNEMYGWDSYFEALGLLVDGKVELAKSMVNNFIYEIKHYGKILNANRTYYLTRSQPPFMTSMALAVYGHLPGNEKNKQWLKYAMAAAIEEYENVWTSGDRLTPVGLSRYYGQGSGQPPEVEEGHFDAVYERFARGLQMTAKELQSKYTAGEYESEKMDEFFTNDRCMRESGHDKTYRFNNKCASFATVGLNSLLYKYEIDLAETIKKEFGGKLKVEGRAHTSQVWYKRAERRKKLMNEYMWDQERGLFLDYNFLKDERNHYLTPVVFYPMWAGLATEEQAESIIGNALAKLEEAGGLAGSTQDARGDISRERPQRQWDYPFGWPPHQMIAWQALENYGYEDLQARLIYRWLYTITENAVYYNGTVPEKFDVVDRTHKVFAEYGNVGTEFDYITKEGFGWMNASFQAGLEELPEGYKDMLNRLVPPEWIWRE